MDALREFFLLIYNFDELIRAGGYAALALIVFAETGLLAGFFLPGDSLLVTAGLLCSTQDMGMNIWLLAGILCAAAIIGDSTGYAIGYHLGARLFKRKESRLFKREYLERTERFYQKHGAKTIVLARFVPIVRTFAPTLAGAARMDYRVFLTYNVAGGIGWVLSMTLAGYWLGRSIPDIEHRLHWVILTVIALSLLPILREMKKK